MGVNIYRNESLIELGTYRTDNESADDVVAGLREKWALLREKELAGDYPVDILVSHILPMSRIQEAFELSASHNTAKVILKPWE